MARKSFIANMPDKPELFACLKNYCQACEDGDEEIFCNDAGIRVVFHSNIHQKFAVIDQNRRGGCYMDNPAREWQRFAAMDLNSAEYLRSMHLFQWKSFVIVVSNLSENTLKAI